MEGEDQNQMGPEEEAAGDSGQDNEEMSTDNINSTEVYHEIQARLNVQWRGTPAEDGRAVTEAVGLILFFLCRVQEEPEILKENVSLLSESGKVLQFLIRVLKELETLQVSRLVHGQVLWILTTIIEHSDARTKKKLADNNLVPFLLPYLNLPQANDRDDVFTFEHAVAVVAQMAQVYELRHQLLSLDIVCELFSFLRTIVTRMSYLDDIPTLSPAVLIRNVAGIIHGLMVIPHQVHDRLRNAIEESRGSPQPREEFIQTFATGSPELRRQVPSFFAAQLAIHTIDILMGVDNKEIRAAMLHTISTIIRIFHSVNLLIGVGLHLKIAAALSDSEDEVILHAGMTLCYMSVRKHNLFQFINSVDNQNQDSLWLKDFWKLLNQLDSGVMQRQHIEAGIKEFLTAVLSFYVMDTEEDPYEETSVWLPIQRSGLIYSLPHFLEGNIPINIKRKATTLLRLLLTQHSVPEQIKFLDNISLASVVKLILDFTTTSSEPLHLQSLSTSAAALLRPITANRPDYRDQAVALGAIPALLRLVEWWSTYPVTNVKALNVVWHVLHGLLKQKPNLNLEAVWEVPAAVQRFWNGGHNYQMGVDNHFVLPAQCLGFVALCGKEAVDLILQQSNILPKLKEHFVSSYQPAKEAAINTILQICKGSTSSRRAVLEAQVLPEFGKLLKDECIFVRKSALEILYAFLYEGILNHSQKIYVLKVLWPLVKEEIKKDNQDTELISALVNEELMKFYGGKEMVKSFY